MIIDHDNVIDFDDEDDDIDKDYNHDIAEEQPEKLNVFQRTPGGDDLDHDIDHYDNVDDNDNKDDDNDKDYNDLAEEQLNQLLKCAPEDSRLTFR